jgi:hypothetical protein
MTMIGKDSVLVEIENAIRRQSWATAQVGQKSPQAITVDFGSDNSPPGGQLIAAGSSVRISSVLSLSLSR